MHLNFADLDAAHWSCERTLYAIPQLDFARKFQVGYPRCDPAEASAGIRERNLIEESVVRAVKSLVPYRPLLRSANDGPFVRQTQR